jgi:hypothetical protein
MAAILTLWHVDYAMNVECNLKQSSPLVPRCK